MLALLWCNLALLLAASVLAFPTAEPAFGDAARESWRDDQRASAVRGDQRGHAGLSCLRIGSVNGRPGREWHSALLTVHIRHLNIRFPSYGAPLALHQMKGWIRCATSEDWRARVFV